ncbi:MAG TPA: hypothetical protein VIW64_08595, partial [Pyrinomonadaceae bacterium]
PDGRATAPFIALIFSNTTLGDYYPLPRGGTDLTSTVDVPLKGFAQKSVSTSRKERGQARLPDPETPIFLDCFALKAV